MVGSPQWILYPILVFVVLVQKCLSDQEYMITTPESMVLANGFETELECEMNISPDKFQWKFYPLPSKDVYNPKVPVDLSSEFVHIPSEKYDQGGRKSTLKLKVKENDTKVAGDYQCLAYYGASVVASVPWRITIATLGTFPEQSESNVIATVGNTVVWRCDPPNSNPEPYIDYYKNSNFVQPSLLSRQIKSLIIENVTLEDSGRYKCNASSSIVESSVESKTSLNLQVVTHTQRRAPQFILQPKNLYTVTRGTDVFLECSAVGNPVPRVTWYKKNGELPINRTDMVSGGLRISNVTANDQGVYMCNHSNVFGTHSHLITLVYNQEPAINCYMNTTDVKQGEQLDIDCHVSGTPEPQIVWFLNGYNVKNDSAIEAIGNKIYFRPVEKRHAGNLQIFATNIVNTTYSAISIKVIPISTSGDSMPAHTTTNHRHNGRKNHHPSRKPLKHAKPPKMIPPDKPTVTRLNDEAVVVRWQVQSNSGLPILFFKVQYRELGPYTNNEYHRMKGTRWRTCNEDIAPHIRSYDVDNLKPDHVYRFRIAAVYSNNDNQLSNNSDKFHLMKLDFDERNPLPVPLITYIESMNTTAIKIYWNCTLPYNVSIEGYFINFNLASRAGDYSKQSVDGAHTNSYVLSHLQPDNFYDIKLQSFTSKTASEFSKIMSGKTLALPTTNAPVPAGPTVNTPHSKTSNGISNLYIVIAAVVLLGAIVIALGCILVVCRKWKQKKNDDDDRHKPAVEEHHIQADGNDYVVRSLPRNGCVPNRITITSNPLADADNKSQNLIEMTCLASQNNNCTSAATASDQSEPDGGSAEKKIKSRDKSKRKKSVEPSPSMEKYV